INAAHQAKVSGVFELNARGFLLRPLLALRLGVPWVPILKACRLDGSNIQVTYKNEYVPNTFEKIDDALRSGQNIIILYNAIASGASPK
ncbi:hypothetical protein K493DRAFT_228022, partial [Basidiobolus meristosporus CBS 931.73]